MKKMLLRALSALTVVSLAAVGSGCGKKVQEVTSEIVTTVSGSGGTYVSGTAGTDGIDNINSGAPSGVSTTGGFDFGGAAVTISKWDKGAEPLASSPTYKKELELISSLEKKYNCKIKFKGTGEDSLVYMKNISSTAAGKSAYADIMIMPSDTAYPSMVLKGYLAELDGIIDLSSSQWNKEASAIMVQNGKHYLTAPYSNIGSLAGGGVFFNKKLFKAAGVKTPEEYVAANNWNWNTFKEVAQKLTDASKGQYGVASISKNYAVTFLLTSNATRSVLNNGSKHTFNLDSPAAIAAISLAGEMKNNGWITNESNVFQNGQAAMTLANWYAGEGYLNALGSDNVGFTFLPLGSNAKDYSEVYVGTGLDVVGISAFTKLDKKGLGSLLMDYTARYNWRATAAQSLEKHFGDSASLDRALKTAEYAYAKLDLQTYYLGFTDTYLWTDFGIDSKTSAQAYVASIKANCQSIIDGVWAGN